MKNEYTDRAAMADAAKILEGVMCRTNYTNQTCELLAESLKIIVKRESAK